MDFKMYGTQDMVYGNKLPRTMYRVPCTQKLKSVKVEYYLMIFLLAIISPCKSYKLTI